MTRCTLWIALLTLSCSDLTAPVGEEASAGAARPAPSPTAATTIAKPIEPRARARKQRMIEEKDERISASHVLISFKGASRAKAGVTRSKQEAKQRAEEVRAKALKGEDFAKLAKQYSDGPSAGKGGDLGSFGKKSMVKPFADAAFALKVGEVSPVVETQFGFHVIKRTK